MNQDRELDKYLQGKSDLSKRYAELPEVELPDHLDAAILAEAHRAVGARPGKPKRRWTIPLGMVATLFVAVMIGLQLPDMLKDADQTQQLREERMAAMMDKSAAERSTVEMETRGKIRELAKAESGFSRNEAVPKAAAPVLAQTREPMAGESRLLGSASVVAPPVQADQLSVPAEQLPAPARAAKSLELKERADADSGAELAKEKKAKEKKAVGQAATATSESAGHPAPAAATMAVPQALKIMRSTNKDESTLSPEDWLSRIKKLKQEGKLEEAGKELAAFKKRYPDFPVPKALEVR